MSYIGEALTIPGWCKLSPAPDKRRLAREVLCKQILVACQEGQPTRLRWKYLRKHDLLAWQSVFEMGVRLPEKRAMGRPLRTYQALPCSAVVSGSRIAGEDTCCPADTYEWGSC